MIGFIPSYFLTGDIGEKIGRIKGMPFAWNSPTILSKILQKPHSLFIYDQIFIDFPSYKIYYDSLGTEEKTTLKNLIESPKLDIFKPINVEEKIQAIDEYEFEVSEGFRILSNESRFIKIVKYITQNWGDYASPSPFKFEAMNIPLVETIRDSIEKDINKDVQIIDHSIRAPLYGISWEKNLAKLLAPEIAQTIIDFTPKVFHIFPHEVDLDINKIIEYRENDYLEAFKNKVNTLSKEQGTKLHDKLKNLDFPDRYDAEGVNIEILFNLDNELKEIQNEIIDEIQDAFNSLRPSISQNKWSILGGTVSLGSEFSASYLSPEGALVIGMAGGAIVLTEQFFNYLRSRKLDWIRFSRSIAETEHLRR